MMVQPILDIVVVEPIDSDRLDLSNEEGFGLQQANVNENEEYLRWRVVAAGPGTCTSMGDPIPNPVQQGDVIIFASVPNKALREHWKKTNETLDGKKFLFCRAFDPVSSIVIVARP